MSYEGDEEYLCAGGHYQRTGHFREQPRVCGQHGCSARIEWHHSIDHTNGFDERDPGTFSAPTVEVGWNDIPMTDHYGNAYFLKHIRGQPAPGSSWTKVPTDEEIAALEAEWERKRAVFAEPSDKHRIFSGAKLLFATDSEEESNQKYTEYLEQNLPDLSAYGPIPQD
jgi:hypothetical protein